MVDLQVQVLDKMVDLVVEEDIQVELVVLQIEKPEQIILLHHKVVVAVQQMMVVQTMALAAVVVPVVLVVMVPLVKVETVDLEHQTYMHMDQEIQ
jgi:hypothetical protein|tara:strand:+ start:150 stop:434 length:285 start_codon:yes stop_codon:yes gene_type:complete